jgi:hypothetical protein
MSDQPAAISPYTGWTRATWLDLADRLLLGLRPCASVNLARFTPPDGPGGYGHDVDGLEGFARSFLLAAFRLVGEPTDPHGFAQWYAQGVSAGVDPTSPDRWVRLTEHPQAKVEAASLAYALDTTRPLIWDHLSSRTQEQVIEYLAPAVGDHTYPRNNWLWFRIFAQTFLKSVGADWSATDVAEDLALHDSFIRDAGWLSDGDTRNYDYYVGWALHFYPHLWARMSGSAELLSAERRAADVARLDRYLDDYQYFFGSDGAPIFQGRSLIYRHATAAPFWAGAVAGVPSHEPGLLRRAASGVAAYFARKGVPDRRGLLTLGYFGEPWPELPQAYSGPGSPYWASHGFLGLALPAEHPVWQATEQPLPIDQTDTVRAITSPGWVVSGTRADGIVRLNNHGSDHSLPGRIVGDTPLYAQIGYSSATRPRLDQAAWNEPTHMAAALADAKGRLAHRSGFTTLDLHVAADVGVAASCGTQAWLDEPYNVGHGHGTVGAFTTAGVVTVVSILRGPWELRLSRIESATPAVKSLVVTGWPVSERGRVAIVAVPPTAATAPQPGRLVFAAKVGEWVAALITLADSVIPEAPAAVAVSGPTHAPTIDVTWPDAQQGSYPVNVATPGQRIADQPTNAYQG